MKLTNSQIDFINEHFHENISENELNRAVFEQLKTPEELHYLAQQHNWDNGVKCLQWIVESPICSEATALELFWLAQPQDFQQTKLDKSLKDIYQNEIFTLIKTILEKYQQGFYQKTAIHFDPTPFTEGNFTIPDFMKEATSGEESYVYFEEDDVEDWFEADWQRKIENADSTIELFNIAYFMDEPEYADWILASPLCDKGIAVLVFWRLHTEAAIYTNTPEKLAEIAQNIENNKFPEVLAYDPKSDEKVKFNNEKIAWEIPEMMKKAV
ncbi:DUF4274 domain-containing protein [Empedobacter sedimenti]|uniref:DUF4274 domain-containing protein n=1 Tax=Empedobacter sedimenti TaxID=3042610 RepID=UPI0024A68F6B|nr:DUF4274 domain-containing protein [Empedobacter sedimenti]